MRLALWHALWHALRQAVVVGFVALLLFYPLTGWFLTQGQALPTGVTPWLLAGGVFLGRLLLNLLPLLPGVGAAWQAFSAPQLPPARVGATHSGWILALGFFGIALTLPLWANHYWMAVAISASIYVLLGLGLNIVVGLAGLLDLGFVAFYAIGAYTYALGAQYLGLSFWQALPLGCGLAALFGALLAFPVLRMHGDYLAIVTLGFGEIIRLILNNWLSFTGGPNGISAPAPTLLGLELTRSAREGGTTFHEFFGLTYTPLYRALVLYLVLLALIALVLFLVQRLRKMPLGRAWEALREDEIACRALGINPVSIKLAAFSLGASIGGLAGVVFAAHQGFVSPTSFTFAESALVLAIVVLGGMGSTAGVVMAALVLAILPELLREFADYRLLLFGTAMVLLMLWRPRGLLPLRRPAYPVKAEAV